MADENNVSSEKLPFEEAINRAGYGLYSYIMTVMTGLAIIAFVCIVYASTIIVPTSACELATTTSQQGLLAAGPVVGTIIGGIVWGYLADTRGRRKMLLVALASSTIFNIIASISVNWVMLLIIQFFASLLASGMYPMAMSLLSETVPMAKRNLVVLIVSSIFLLSQGLMAALAIPIIPLRFSYFLPALGIYWNSWRTVLLVYTLPNIITGVWLIFMEESPKFVFIKGDEERALKILRRIHRINHLGSKEELQMKGLLNEEATEGPASGSSKDQIVPLFRAPLLKYTLIMCTLLVFQQVGAFIVWLPTIADRFVRILQTEGNTNLTMCGIINMEVPIDEDAVPCALNESALLIVLGVAVLQSVVNIVFSIVVNTVGRRNIVMLVTAMCGLSGILVNLVPNAIGSAALYAIMVMGIVVFGLYTAIIVALFPTHLRAIAIAIPLTLGRVGSFAVIQILNLMLTTNCDAGFYLFSSIFGASAIVASFLPDDRRLQRPVPSEKTDQDVQNGEMVKSE